MRKTNERIFWGVIFIIGGIFLIINQFAFKIAFFPWILLAIGIVAFLMNLFSGEFWGGLQALIWLGGLTFAFYYDQLLPGIIIIIGVSIIISAIRDMFRRYNKVEININENKDSNA